MPPRHQDTKKNNNKILVPSRLSGKVILGIERLRCPRCGRMNAVAVHSDLPERDWMTCRFCSYRAVISFIPILDKYGLPHGLSRPERREFGKHLKKDLIKI